MKYKVIGWTWYDSYEIPFYDKTIGFAERNAIIDEIRKNKYLFSGWHHQESWENCVPILNDGKKRGFSQRGWGGLMAEAYGHMNDYDYSCFTFHQSIESKSLCFPKNVFNSFEFVSEPLENEHFDIDVKEELFAIAKKKNPFYLEDDENLRFIDTNDTITLHCNNEELTFLVEDINRDKKELKFKEHHLINTKYKIILTYRPMAKVFTRIPLMISRSDANDVFKECLREYNFYTLFELIDTFDLDVITNESKAKRVISLLKRFVREYTDYAFNESIVNKVLYYINDFDFLEEISYKTVNISPSIFAGFMTTSYKKGINVDKHIPLLLKVYKNDYYISDILLRAIDLNPTNKSLRKRYYKENKIFNLNSFLLYMGINEFNLLSKDHKRLVELYDFTKIKSYTILDIAYLMSYSHVDISKYNNLLDVPSFYSSAYECIKDGILKYQKYVNEKYDLEYRLYELFINGIKIRCNNIDNNTYDERDVALYVYTLDVLSEFKYSLKDKSIELCPRLKAYLEEIYK